MTSNVRPIPFRYWAIYVLLVVGLIALIAIAYGVLRFIEQGGLFWIAAFLIGIAVLVLFDDVLCARQRRRNRGGDE